MWEASWPVGLCRSFLSLPPIPTQESGNWPSLCHRVWCSWALWTELKSSGLPDKSSSESPKCRIFNVTCSIGIDVPGETHSSITPTFSRRQIILIVHIRKIEIWWGTSKKSLNWGPQRQLGRPWCRWMNRRRTLEILNVSYVVRAWTGIPGRSLRMPVLSSRDFLWSRFEFSSVAECLLILCGTLDSILPLPWINKPTNKNKKASSTYSYLIYFYFQKIRDKRMTGVHGESWLLQGLEL